MATYYVLATATKPLPTSGDFLWPYEVSLAFEGAQHPVGVAEGVGHGAAAAFLAAAEALEPSWAAHFESADAGWLVPFVRRMAAGERVQAQEVITAYRDRNGSEPKAFDHASSP
ncbi:hypothetical protein [Variovorax sp. N23]|uniref:hypothetical protein n=1 Tax=Variovorax sp. N23 TaxID=2980555 RepID=UPI0021CAA9B5|nr:hypothetical protein [Variovorax sp. N23]MCU4122010.1 hypothetical protein [Variovorax sp. N23]